MPGGGSPGAGPGGSEGPAVMEGGASATASSRVPRGCQGALPRPSPLL